MERDRVVAAMHLLRYGDQAKVSDACRRPGGLLVPVLSGVPDAWPHIAAVLTQAGFRPTPERAEAVYGGELAGVPAPSVPRWLGCGWAGWSGRPRYRRLGWEVLVRLERAWGYEGGAAADG